MKKSGELANYAPASDEPELPVREKWSYDETEVEKVLERRRIAALAALNELKSKLRSNRHLNNEQQRQIEVALSLEVIEKIVAAAEAKKPKFYSVDGFLHPVEP